MVTRTVIGQYLNIDGTPVKGYLEFKPSSTIAQAAIIPVSTTRAVLDATGSFSIVLQVTDEAGFIPAGWLWSVEEKIPNGNQWYLEVPTGASPLDIASAYIIGSNGGPYYGITGPTGPTSTVPGPVGPPNVLSIGTVTDGGPADATITGTSPAQVLNLTLPNGPQGIPGPVVVSDDANNLAVIGTDSKLYVPNNQGGADEVNVGTGAPTDPNTQLWIETDAVPVPKMRYRESSVGPWTEVGGSDEVAIQNTTPAQAGLKLWVDTDAVSLSPSGYGNTYNFRNKAINGDFSVNQRNTSSSAVADVYVHDRWKLASVTGGTFSYSVQTPALGDLPESAKSFARVTVSGQSGNSDLCRLGQKIESVRTLSGKKITVSFWAKAASGTPKVSVELEQLFGTGGSPSSYVPHYAGTVTLSTTWTRYSVTTTLSSLTGKTLGTVGDDTLSLTLWVSGGSTFNSRIGSIGLQANTFDFWGVQLEEGSRATPFEQHEYAYNLRRCQRYFYRKSTNAAENILGAISCNTAGGYLCFLMPVEMRVTPSIGYTGVWGIYDGTAVYNITAMSAPIKDKQMVRIDCTASGTITGRAGFVTGAADSIFDFSAEYI